MVFLICIHQNPGKNQKVSYWTHTEIKTGIKSRLVSSHAIVNTPKYQAFSSNTENENFATTQKLSCQPSRFFESHYLHCINQSMN